MFDPVTFVLALALLASASLYVRAKRKRRQMREFDGGWRHDHPRVTTVIYSQYIKQKDH